MHDGHQPITIAYLEHVMLRLAKNRKTCFMSHLRKTFQTVLTLYCQNNFMLIQIISNIFTASVINYSKEIRKLS